MKVFLDLTRLLNEGKITQAEFDKFSQLSTQNTTSLAFNLLIGFGVVAVVFASVALVPSPFTAILLGIIICAAGIGMLRLAPKWNLLAQMCVPVGGLLLCAGLLWLYEFSPTAWIIVTLLLLAGSLVVRHGLLMVLAVLALAATIGASSSYYHATYAIVIEQPALTVILFSVLSLFAYWFSKRIPAEYERLAIIAARTSIFLVNFGFWVGSLWGDTLPHNKGTIPDWVFAIAWAVALIIVAVWAIKSDKRWLLNVVAVFAAIHFFTQWFDRLGASPGTVLIAGLLALGFALALKKWNVKLNN